MLETAHPTVSLCWREACVWLLSTVTSLERPKSPRSPQQSHWFAAADCFSPSLPVGVTDRPPKNSCGYLPPAKVPLRKWDQAKQETTKAQRERETSQSAGFLCAHKATALTQKTSDRQAEGQSNHLVRLYTAPLLDLTFYWKVLRVLQTAYATDSCWEGTEFPFFQLKCSEPPLSNKLAGAAAGTGDEVHLMSSSVSKVESHLRGFLLIWLSLVKHFMLMSEWWCRLFVEGIPAEKSISWVLPQHFHLTDLRLLIC